jgi:hypothetical protein
MVDVHVKYVNRRSCELTVYFNKIILPSSRGHLNLVFTIATHSISIQKDEKAKEIQWNPHTNEREL